MIKNVNGSFISLIGVLFCLPLFEAPKTYFYLLFVIFWLLSAWKHKSWGGRWVTIDSIFMLWIFVALLASFNATLNYGYSASGFFDVFRYISLGWLISRSSFTEKEVTFALAVTTIATLIALLQAYIDCPSGGVCFELNSVGHVNHSAIYLLLNFSFIIAFLIFSYKRINKLLLFFFSVAICLLIWTIFDTHSRAASGAMLIVLLGVIFLWLTKQKSKKSWGIAFLCLFIASITVYKIPPFVLTKHLDLMQYFKTKETPRSKIWRFSLYTFQAHPLLGVGFGNFKKLKLEDIGDKVEIYKHNFDKSINSKFGHPHNIYLYFLVSGGVMITAVFLWFWGWLVFLLRRTKINRDESEYWLWVANANIIVINLGVGFVNSTFHHENAILSMIIIAFFIGLQRSKSRKFEENT